MVFFKKKKKNVVNFSYLDYLDFRACLRIKINDLFQIGNIEALCCLTTMIIQNMIPNFCV